MKMSTHHHDAQQAAAAAAYAKHGPDSERPCAMSAELFRCVHAAVTIACTGMVDRRTIERRLGMGHRTLDDYLAAKPAMMRFDHVARMLLDPTVLGAEAHGMLAGMVAGAMGQVTIGAGVRFARDEDITLETLDVGDAVGALCERVREAQHPDSPGGTTCTPAERCGIGSHARVVVINAAELMEPAAMPGRDAHGGANA